MDLDAIEMELAQLVKSHRQLASHFKVFYGRLAEMAAYKQTMGRDVFPVAVGPLEGDGRHFTMEFVGTPIRVEFAFEPQGATSRAGIVRWTKLDPIGGKPVGKSMEFAFHQNGDTGLKDSKGMDQFITDPGHQYFLGAHILRASVVKPAATSSAKPLNI